MAAKGLLTLAGAWAAGPESWRPRTAMVLAAGLGLRMRPLTERVPKPLIEVAGRPLIDYALDHLAAAGVETALVNLHHLGDQIERHLAARVHPAIRFSRETTLLETGGGVVRALPELGKDAFYVVNSDVLWLDGPVRALGRLAAAWAEDRMDGLLLLHSTARAYGYNGLGDFMADPTGCLMRRPEREVAPYLFTGIQILHPRAFRDLAEEPFSLNRVYDRLIADGRLYGLVHDGEWFDVGTPQGLEEADAFMRMPFPGRERL
ncbi:MAG: nucleotidyltransferase family protein [Proteobacteria bacterium]|nr:nucleotidyltransferase family protein [Pseudomonadota bacterium]